MCHAFSGPNAEQDRDNVCAVGNPGTACPAGSIGRCDLSGVNTNPQGYVQYHYASAGIADPTASKSLCDAGGGTWSP